MKKKILAFGASSSKESINKKFAAYAARLLEGVEVEILDLNNFEMPIYSIDKEKEMSGVHQLAKDFKHKIDHSDGIVISFAEHNGNVSAAFKNIYDWVSRLDAKVWSNKPMLVLATSPGGRGGKNVLDIVVPGIKRQNESAVFVFSLPSFYDNFNLEIANPVLKEEFLVHLEEFKREL